MEYTVNGSCIYQEDGLVYECETQKEASDIAAAGNLFLIEKQRDYKDFEELVEFMGWDKNPPKWY